MPTAVVLLACLCASLPALEPLPAPVEPRNKKDVSQFGDAREIKAEGYFLYSRADGIVISPIYPFAPQVIPNTGPSPAFIDISDDGRWIAFASGGKGFLIRPDGSCKTQLPLPQPLPQRKYEPQVPVGFYHNGPCGSEVVYIADERTIVALGADLSGDSPRLGQTRSIVDFPKVQADRLVWASNMEQRFTVAGSHVFVCKSGSAGTAQPAMITIPQGGKGVATSAQDLFDRKKAPKWECGLAMSHDGRIVAQNPGGGDGKVLPVGIGHKGPVVYPFFEAGEPGLDTTSGLYVAKALAICWVPQSVRDIEGDWHHWCFSSDDAYIIGVSQGRRGLKGNVADFKAIGIYLLHWPTGTFYRVSDDKTRAAFMACHFFGPETRKSIRLPADFGKASVTATPAPASQAAEQPKAASIVVEVTAREVSSVPAASDIGVYKHISRYILYDVDRVVSGEYAGKSIVIGHWSVADGAFTAAAKYKVGDKFTITCRLIGDDDAITLAQRVDEIEDIDVPRYWATAVKERPAGTGK